MSNVGKKFKKVTEIEVIGESKHNIEFQNVNNQSENLTMTREAFEANYVEVVNQDATTTGDTEVSNKNETKTKEVTK